MKVAIYIIGLLLFVLIGFIVIAAIFIDPGAIMVPGWLLNGGWRQECVRSPVASYVSGQYFPCTGSPLTRENANSPIKNWNGRCPLSIATSYKNIAAFDELTSLGATTEKCSDSSDRFFEMVLSRHCGDTKAATSQLLERFERLGLTPSDPNKLLFVSAKGECAIGVALAIKKGADVNTTDELGRSALYYAARATKAGIETTVTLVASGADPNLKSAKGETIYEMAKRSNESTSNWPLLEQALLGKGNDSNAIPNK